MKTGRTSAAVLGLAGGLALGVWIGSAMTLDRDSAPTEPTLAQLTEPVANVEPTPAKPRRVVARTASRTPPAASGVTDAPKLVMTIPVSAPELHDRMKPVLARGTKINLAVEGFTDAEQFATLAYAARNTQVPFILLKRRVLTEGQSLANAIRASKPDLDADAEVKRARSAAKSDLAVLNTVANPQRSFSRIERATRSNAVL